MCLGFPDLISMHPYGAPVIFLGQPSLFQPPVHILPYPAAWPAGPSLTVSPSRFWSSPQPKIWAALLLCRRSVWVHMSAQWGCGCSISVSASAPCSHNVCFKTAVHSPCILPAGNATQNAAPCPGHCAPEVLPYVHVGDVTVVFPAPPHCHQLVSWGQSASGSFGWLYSHPGIFFIS